jgi:hypothetical protein
MLPDYIKSEVVRRVGVPTRELARTLGIDPDARGRTGRSISRLMFTYDVLEWRNLNDFDPVTGEHRRMELPQWVPIRLDLLLHPQLLRQIQDLVEEQAVDIERRRRSHS